MSDTPRTDAFCRNYKCKNGKSVTRNYTFKELEDFARSLERELIRKHKIVIKMNKQWIKVSV